MIEPNSYIKLVRAPSAMGVAKLYIVSSETGRVVVPLWRNELRRLAMEALAAMEPEEPIHDESCQCKDCKPV